MSVQVNGVIKETFCHKSDDYAYTNAKTYAAAWRRKLHDESK